MKKILQYGSPVLEMQSKMVEDLNDPKVDKVINEMLKILNVESDRSAGLSAPQIGELLTIAVCRRTDLEKPGERVKNDKINWEVMINPVLTYKSDMKSTNWEGCLSVNFGDLFGKVERPFEVEVEYYDIFKKKKKLGAKGFFSHVIQHEHDHLNGVLFLKYIKDPSQLFTGEEFED